MHEAWFDTGTGKVAIGQEAVDELIVQAGHMAVPLADLLTSNEFGFKVGDFDRIAADSGFSPEDGISVGKAVARMLMQPYETIPMTEEHIKRMNILGLFPDNNFVKRRYGSLSNFRNLVGAERPRPSSNFDDVPLTELFHSIYKEHLRANPGVPISIDELNKLHNLGRLPSYKYLYHRFGGVKKINEYLGYPNVDAWDVTDYILYGVQVLSENGEGSLSIKNVIKLAEHKFGPYPQAIKKRFGSWDVYKQLAQAEWQRQTVIEHAKQTAISNHFTEMGYSDPTIPDYEKRKIWARYHVADDYLHATNPEILKTLSLLDTTQFIRELKTLNPNKTVADIELIALSLNVFDDLWSTNYIRQPSLQNI